MKLTTLHFISHAGQGDHSEQCATCDYAVTVHLTPVLYCHIGDAQQDEIDIFFPKEKTSEYHISVSSTIEVNQLFSRPPPVLC